MTAASLRPAAIAHALLQPQEWYDVTAPPPGIARAAGALVARHGAETLAPHELCDLVAKIGTRSDLWRPLLVCDRRRRRYRLMFEDPRLDIWVLSWMPGQATGYHDHGISNVALTTLQGVVLERQIRIGKASIECELLPGFVQPGRAGYIHSVAHRSGAPAVTLHAYSPPLLEVGQYRAGPGEELFRESQHGRRELLDHTIGDIPHAENIQQL
jgi:predicted metal-dependent enzyme (double-stranded beta helix superfamily)